MHVDVHVNAVIFREGEAWVAQGVEVDIVAHANGLAEAVRAVERALVANVMVSSHLGRAPLGGVPAAPEKFRRMLEAAERISEPVHSRAANDDGPVVDIWLAATA